MIKKPKGWDTASSSDNYADFMEQHGEEVLQSAMDAIDPAQLTYEEFIRLGGAICTEFGDSGFTYWDEIGRRDTARYKGSLNKYWRSIHGAGKHGEATKATIYEYAKRNGWTWPAPADFGYQADKPARIQTKTREADPPQNDNLICAPGKLISDNALKIQCYIDSQEYTDKPANRWEIRQRCESVPMPAPQEFTAKELTQAIVSGRTFYPTVFQKELDHYDENGKAVYRHPAISQQIFVVDIDNEEQVKNSDGKPVKQCIEEPLTIEAAKEKCAAAGVNPFLIYETFSSKYHREDPEKPYTKFRLCFVTDKPITAQEYGERGLDAIREYFINLFGKAADPAIKDNPRFIYGTAERDRAHLYDSTISSKALIDRVFNTPAPADPPQEDSQEEQEEQLQPVADFADLFRQHREETKQNIRTGFLNLDIALGGGFGNELYILGAETSTGKSAISSVLAQNIAQAGVNVLYYALEMGRDEFIARGASAISKEYDGELHGAIPYGEILNDTYDPQTKQFYRRAYSQYAQYVQEYFRRYGQHLYIIEGGLTGRTARSIAEAATKFKEEHEGQKLAIFIDYLQLLSADPEDKTQRDFMNIMSTAVKIFKALASQVGMTVFLISSMANDRKGERVNDASFKYSGDIGYTGGVLLGWNWHGVTDTKKKEDRLQTIKEAKETGCRNMFLEVLKHRNNARDNKVELSYYPAYNYIEEGKRIIVPAAEDNFADVPLK